LTADVLLSDGSEATGQSFIDNIELINMGQQDDEKAGIRFENSRTKPSFVTNSVIHDTLGWGFRAKGSTGLLFEGNVIFETKQVGFAMDNSDNFIIKDNIVGSV